MKNKCNAVAAIEQEVEAIHSVLISMSDCLQQLTERLRTLDQKCLELRNSSPDTRYYTKTGEHRSVKVPTLEQILENPQTYSVKSGTKVYCTTPGTKPVCIGKFSTRTPSGTRTSHISFYFNNPQGEPK